MREERRQRDEVEKIRILREERRPPHTLAGGITHAELEELFRATPAPLPDAPSWQNLSGAEMAPASRRDEVEAPPRQREEEEGRRHSAATWSQLNAAPEGTGRLPGGRNCLLDLGEGECVASSLASHIAGKHGLDVGLQTLVDTLLGPEEATLGRELNSALPPPLLPPSLLLPALAPLPPFAPYLPTAHPDPAGSSSSGSSEWELI